MKKQGLLLMAACWAAVGGIAAQGANENTCSLAVGRAEVVLLSEGQSTGRTGILLGAAPEVVAWCAPQGTFPMAVNAFLVKMNGRNILVDTGDGRELFDNLTAVGVAPEQVDALLLTHLHGDHTGGMLRDGAAAFPNAELYLSEAEFEHGRESAATRIAAYGGRVHLFTPGTLEAGGEPILDGIGAVAAYGHTPGHTMYWVESDGSRLLIWGDLTHAMAFQMPYPEISVTYDTDPVAAAAVRLATLRYLAEENLPLAGMHIPWPGMGAIAPGGSGGYLYSPVEPK